jgi:hypothetical protein
MPWVVLTRLRPPPGGSEVRPSYRDWPGSFVLCGILGHDPGPYSLPPVKDVTSLLASWQVSETRTNRHACWPQLPLLRFPGNHPPRHRLRRSVRRGSGRKVWWASCTPVAIEPTNPSRTVTNSDVRLESILCWTSIRRWRFHAPPLPGRTALKDFAASTDIAAACDLLNLPLRALSIIHVDACACCQTSRWWFNGNHRQALLDAVSRG